MLDQNVTLPAVQDYVETLIRTKTTAYVVAHKLDGTAGENQWSIDDYRALLDRLQTMRASGDLTLSTITKWYRRTVRPIGE